MLHEDKLEMNGASKEASGKYMDDIWAYILLAAEQEDITTDMKDNVSIEIPDNIDGYAILHKCAVLCFVVSQCTYNKLTKFMLKLEENNELILGSPLGLPILE